MHAQRPALLSRRHLGWLLWLVLLLPIAQTAATWHVLSHARAELLGDDSQQIAQQEQCDLCFSAAALLGGAPLRSAGVMPESRALPLQLGLPPRGNPLPAPARAYDSRAPPLSLL